MSIKPTRAKPRPKPSARPVTIEDAARKRRERELDARIEALRPAMARADAYYRHLGVDMAVMSCSVKALALWNGRAAVSASIPRSIIF
jgi:hypothetical protein